jgi:CspA family cold shock protein
VTARPRATPLTADLRTNIHQKTILENERLQKSGSGLQVGTLIPATLMCLFAMANGKVDFFNDTGGYGFIDTEDADDDVFFHMEDVGGEDLTEGTEISFDIEQAPKGPRATNVVRE